MKQLIIALFLLSVFFLFTCSKEELETPKTNTTTSIIESSKEIVLDDLKITFEGGLRTGIADIIFFTGMFTTDNFIVAELSEGEVQRTHEAYNKARVDYIDYSPGTLPLVSIGSSKYRHYTLSIQYKDSTEELITAYAKDSLINNRPVLNYRLTASGANYMLNSNTSKKIRWVRGADTQTTYNEFRNRFVQLWEWDVFRNNEFLESKFKEPVNAASLQFQPTHYNK